MASDYRTMFKINNMFVNCKQCPIFRNLNSIKPLINIFNIEFYGFYHFNTIFHTVHIYSGLNSEIITLIIDYRLTWVL